MGLFSWMFADTDNKKSLLCGEKGYIICPDNTLIGDPHYEGYGQFSGVDIYELVVYWNRKFLADHPEHVLPTNKTRVDRFAWYPYLADFSIPLDEIPERCPSDIWSGELRSIGIEIACHDEDNASLAYPIKIVSNPHVEYNDLPPSKSDPNQGCRQAREIKEESFKINTMKLSQAEKDLINRMNHPMYTVSFIESWLNRPPANVYSNAPTALQQCMVEGFMQAVRAMAALEGRDITHG